SPIIGLLAHVSTRDYPAHFSKLTRSTAKAALLRKAIFSKIQPWPKRCGSSVKKVATFFTKEKSLTRSTISCGPIVVFCEKPISRSIHRLGSSRYRRILPVRWFWNSTQPAGHRKAAGGERSRKI